LEFRVKVKKDKIENDLEAEK
jgi:hypothetical protein